MELSHLKSFTVVARLGNLSAAAKELGTTQPNLGRQMTALAKEVGMDLFVRHSRGVSLTNEGQEFLELCKQTIGRLDQGASLIRERKQKPQGTLKVVLGSAALEVVLPKLSQFSIKYPELDFKFITLKDVFQFQIGDADVGLLPVIFRDPEIVQVHAVDASIKIYASPTYLNSNSHPKTLSDLQNHKLIIYDVENPEVYRTHNILPESSELQAPLRKHIETNNGSVLRNALINGLGIGSFAYTRTLVEENLLIDVFPFMPARIVPYYYTYHKSLEGSPKLKAFGEFLEEIIHNWDAPKSS